MQLHKFWVNGYKNLIDTSIDFDGCITPISIIGNNGSGKSNLIEALLEVFMGLYYNSPPDYDFKLAYSAHGKEVIIERDCERQSFNIVVDGEPWSMRHFRNRVRHTNGMPPFPALIFGYYSGTCNRVEKLLKRYERTFSYKIRNQSENLERNFVFSDVDQAKWILISLIAHGHEELLRKISVGGARDLKITIEPPKNYDPTSEDIILLNTTGAVREFLAAMENFSLDTTEKRDNNKEFVSTLSRTYNFPLRNEEDVNKLRKLGLALEKRGANLYSMLQACHSNKILKKINYDVYQTDNDNGFSFEALSEGEKQLLCVVGGLTMAQHQECLVLLDEPDTHLNPNWSWEYDSLLKQALHSEQLSNSTVLLATHDPVIISGLRKEQVLIAHKENGALSYQRPHRDPRGQGIANILTSEFFGLPSSLDEYTQSLLDQRLALAYANDRLNEEDQLRLKAINSELESLGLAISLREPKYKEFEKSKYEHGGDQ
jgi:energy-coupling factor transporter ATP-binding protein EcfA2